MNQTAGYKNYTGFEQPETYARGMSAAIDPAAEMTIVDRLEHSAAQIVALAEMAEDTAVRIYGPEPTALGKAGASPIRPPPCLVGVASDIEDALARLNRALDRIRGGL